MPKGKPAASRGHARSAVSGRFVKLSYAKRPENDGGSQEEELSG